MSSDDQVFRSSVPHEVSLPEGGSDAIGKLGHAGQGESRELQTTTVFAPLDDPPAVDGVRVVPVIEPAEVGDTAPEQIVQAASTETSSETGSSPLTGGSRPPERYRLSGGLMARAAEIRMQTARLAAQMESVDRSA